MDSDLHSDLIYRRVGKYLYVRLKGCFYKLHAVRVSKFYKFCIKQFGHLCNWELGSVSSLEAKIIKEPLRRQLLETKLKIHIRMVHMSYPIWRLFKITVYV